MRKLLSVLLMMLLLGGCMNEREDYYIFSFGDYTLTPGYDNVEYARLIFDLQLPETIGANSRIEKNEVYFWDHYLCDLDLINESKKEIPIDEAIISRLDTGAASIIFFPNEIFSHYINYIDTEKQMLVSYSNGYGPYVLPIDFEYITYEMFTDTLTKKSKEKIIETIQTI